MMMLDASPRTGADLVFPNGRCELVYDKFVRGGKPNWLLLEGGYGTGKTEAAPVMLRERVPGLQNGDIITLNAATKAGGVEGMRSAFHALRYVGLNEQGVRCLIINEVDRFSGVAGRELKGELDEVAHLNLPIILTTNEPGELEGSIISRFTTLNWERPPADKLLARAKAVLARHSLALPDDRLLHLIRLARHELRKLFTEVLPLAI